MLKIHFILIDCNLAIIKKLLIFRGKVMKKFSAFWHFKIREDVNFCFKIRLKFSMLTFPPKVRWKNSKNPTKKSQPFSHIQQIEKLLVQKCTLKAHNYVNVPKKRRKKIFFPSQQRESHNSGASEINKHFYIRSDKKKNQ